MFSNFIGKRSVLNINSYVVPHQRGNNCASMLDGHTKTHTAECVCILRQFCKVNERAAKIELHELQHDSQICGS